MAAPRLRPLFLIEYKRPGTDAACFELAAYRRAAARGVQLGMPQPQMRAWATGTLSSKSGDEMCWTASAIDLHSLVEGLATADPDNEGGDGLFSSLESLDSCAPSLGITPEALWKRVVRAGLPR